MSLYVPDHFAVHDRAAIARLVHDHPFATLVTPTAGEPPITHLPLIFVPDREPHGTLLGHFARANPHVAPPQRPPRIRSRSSTARTRTFRRRGMRNRRRPCRRGTMRSSTRTAGSSSRATRRATRAILDIMIHRFESHRAAPWQLGLDRERLDAMVGAIVGFRIEVKRIDAKFKLSQNRTPDDRARVADALAAEGHADADATAAWMRIYAPARRWPGLTARLAATGGAVDHVRFDKWLWAARFYKTRTLAAQAIDAGQARLAGERVKPAHAVRPGDAVSIRRHGIVVEVAVTALADRRGSAAEAAMLYRETEASAAAREDDAMRRRQAAAVEPRFAGRPTKRERRKLEDFLNEPWAAPRPAQQSRQAARSSRKSGFW